MGKTTVECPGCGKRLNAPEGSRATAVRCSACGERFALKSAVMEQHDDTPPEDRTERAGRRPASLWIVFTLLLVLSIVAVPMAIVSSLGVQLSQRWPLPNLGALGLLLMAPVGIGLLAAAIGLALLKSWARPLAVACLLIGVVYYAKLIVPVLASLNWKHRDAQHIATVVAIFHGAPMLLFLAALGALFAPGLRAALARSTRSPRRRAGS